MVVVELAYLFEIEIPQESAGLIPTAPNRYVISVNTKAIKNAWIDSVKALINVTVTSKEYKPELTPSLAPGGTDTEEEANEPTPIRNQTKLEAVVASDMSENEQETIARSADIIKPRLSNASFRKEQATTTARVPNALRRPSTEQVTRTKSLTEIAGAFEDKLGSIESSTSLSVYASQGRISLEATGSQTALDSVTKMTIASLRNRLKEQQKLIHQQSADLHSASDKIIALERKSTESSHNTAQMTQQLLSLSSEKDACLKQVESVKNDSSQSANSYQLTIAQLQAQVKSLMQERIDAKRHVEMERSTWETRLETERKEMRGARDQAVDLVLTQMDRQSRALTRKNQEIQETSRKREEDIARLEAEKIQQVNRFSQEMTKGSAVAQNVEMLQRSLIEANNAVQEYRKTIATLEADHADIQQTSLVEHNMQLAEKQQQVDALRQQLEDRGVELEKREFTLQCAQLEHAKTQECLEQALQSTQEVSSHVVETQVSLEKSQRESRDKQIEISSLNSIQAQLVAKIQRQSEMLTSAEGTIHELRLQNDKYREQTTALHETIARMDTESHQHYASLEAVLVELKNAGMAYESLEERFEKAQSDLQRLEGVEQEFFLLQQKYSELEGEGVRLHGVETEYTKLVLDNKRLEEMFQSTESTLRDTKQSLDASLQQEQQLLSDLMTTRSQLQDTNLLLEQSRAENQTLSAERKALEDTLASTKTSKGELESVKIQLEQEVADIKHKMRAASILKKRWKDSEMNNTELHSNLEAATQNIAELENDCQILRDKEENAKKQIRELETDLQSGKETIQQLESVVQARTKDRSELLSVLTSISSRMGLESFMNLDAVEKDKLLAVVESLARLQQQRDGLVDDLHTLQSKYQSGQEKIASLELNHGQEKERSRAEHQQSLAVKEQELAIQNQEVTRLKDLLQSTETRFKDSQERWETQLHALEEHNRELRGQVQLLTSMEDDRREAKVWIDKFDGLQSKYMTAQKDMISLQAEVVDLREQLEAAVVELDHQEEDILLKKAELRLSHETIQGLKLRIQHLIIQNGTTSSHTAEDLHSIKYSLERDNQRLQTQVHTLETKLQQQLGSQPLSAAVNDRSDMLPQLEKFSPVGSQRNQARNTLDHHLPLPFNTKDRPSTEMVETWKKKESDIYQRINGCLRNLSDLTRLRSQYERDVTSLLGLDDDQKSASMTLQFLELATKLDAVSVQNSGAFDKGIGSMRSEFAYILGSVKELIDELLRLSVHKRGEQSALVQDLQAAVHAAQSLHDKNQELHTEITQLHVELARHGGGGGQNHPGPEGVPSEWCEQEHEMQEEMTAVQNQLLSVFDSLVQSDPFVKEKAARLRETAFFFVHPGNSNDDDGDGAGTGAGARSGGDTRRTTAFSPERFKTQLRFVKGFLQAVTIHASSFLRRQQSEAFQTPPGHRATSNNSSGDEPMVTASELQRSLNAANVIIHRLKSALEQASNEHDQSQQSLQFHRSELKKLKDAYVHLQAILSEREEDLSRLRTTLSHKEEEMRDLFTEKTSFSQIVMQACTELETLVVE